MWLFLIAATSSSAFFHSMRAVLCSLINAWIRGVIRGLSFRGRRRVRTVVPVSPHTMVQFPVVVFVTVVEDVFTYAITVGLKVAFHAYAVAEWIFSNIDDIAPAWSFRNDEQSQQPNDGNGHQQILDGYPLRQLIDDFKK